MLRQKTDDEIKIRAIYMDVGTIGGGSESLVVVNNRSGFIVKLAFPDDHEVVLADCSRGETVTEENVLKARLACRKLLKGGLKGRSLGEEFEIMKLV